MKAMLKMQQLERVTCAAAALALSACATTGASGDPIYRYSESRGHVGRIYHYLRSNRDGSLPEHIHVFHKAKDKVEVYKMVQKCTGAALVTADLDYDIWSATRFVGGRLGRNADQIAFATLTLDQSAPRLDAVVNLPDRTLTQSLDLKSLPWRLYDFDFAEFTVFSQHLKNYRRDFSVEMAVVVADPDAEDFLKRLGAAKAIAQGRDKTQGVYRFALAGDAFSAGGTLLLDAKDGHVVEVDTAVPNHAEYEDFKLTLLEVNDGGESGWRSLLLAHFEGCEQN